MPKYINGINVSSLALGEGSGIALTTGDRNTLLGNSAGSSLTTAGYNTFVGSYTGSTEPDCQDAVVLSNGRGTVVCRWDGTGTCEQTVNDASVVTAPTINGRVRMGVDPATGALIYRTRLPSGQVATSYTNMWWMLLASMLQHWGARRPPIFNCVPIRVSKAVEREQPW